MIGTKDYPFFEKKEELKAVSVAQIGLAALSGLLLTASFPPFRLGFIAWFSLVPLLISLRNESPSQTFKLGFLTGIVHYLTLIYWILVVLGHYGNMNIFVSIGPLILLCMYLALYPAAFSVFITSLKGFRLDLIFFAGFWVGLEYLRANFLTGFPWCLLGYSQYRYLHFIQIADLTGVYGISFVIVLSNMFISRLLSRYYKRRTRFLGWDTIMIIFCIGSAVAYGQFRLSEKQMAKDRSRVIKAAIIQGNIDQSVKWDPSYQNETIEIYERLTRSVYDFKPDLIVWPETSAPFFFQETSNLSKRISLISEVSKAAHVIGSPAYKRMKGEIRYYNRAYLLTPDGSPPQQYDKVHLVPFGEYVPLKKLLFFISRLVPAAGNFEAGKNIFPLKYRELSIGILICFEAIFPELARGQTTKGANILINITNDAWFGRTSAPYQHLSMATFRAVENRKYLIRSANTGFSAFIDPYGQIISRGSLFREQVLKGTLTISKSKLTFYTRFGELFAFALLAISLIRIILFFWKRLVVHE